MWLFGLEAVFHRCFGFGRGAAGACLAILLGPQRLLLDRRSGVLTEKGDELSPLVETASSELHLDRKHFRNRLVQR